jgi:hypothetical protein
MISLTIPLFLVLMILLIFYIFDLHLSIKSRSNTVSDLATNNNDSESSWMDDLPGASYFSEVTSDTNAADVTDSSSTPDASGATWDMNTPLDASGTAEEIASYDRDDVIAMLNSIAVNTNVGVVISDTDPSGTQTDTSGAQTDPSGTDLASRVSYLESVISNFVSSHQHELPRFNKIYSEISDDTKLCDYDPSGQCNDYEDCAFKCSADDDCAGWVYDLSNAYSSTCKSYNVNVENISGWQSVQNQGDLAYTGGITEGGMNSAAASSGSSSSAATGSGAAS